MSTAGHADVAVFTSNLSKSPVRDTSFVRHICATWENVLWLPRHTGEHRASCFPWDHLPGHYTVTFILPLHTTLATQEGLQSHGLLKYAQEGRHCANPLLDDLTQLSSPSQAMGGMAGSQPSPRAHQHLNSTVSSPLSSRESSFPLGWDK